MRQAREAGHDVTPLPGASSVLAALVSAGLPSDRFYFEGFLPPKQAQRRARLAELSRVPATLVLFETGPRLADALADLATSLGDREAAICRELTKLHEEVRRGGLADLAAHYAKASEPRGEIVIVIGPPAEGEEPAAGKLDDLLREALTRASIKDAVGEVAVVTGLPRREVYQRALALAKVDRWRPLSRRAPRPRRSCGAQPSGLACRRRRRRRPS